MGAASKLVLTAIRKHPCLFCGAGVGEQCVSANGLPTSLEHQARYKAAVEAGDLPIDLGEFY